MKKLDHRIDTPELKAERARHASRSGRHVVMRVDKVKGTRGKGGLAYYLSEPKGRDGKRFATDRLADADHFYGVKDAERAAHFAGPEWEAVAVRDLSKRPVWSRIEQAAPGVGRSL